MSRKTHCWRYGSKSRRSVESRAEGRHPGMRRKLPHLRARRRCARSCGDRVSTRSEIDLEGRLPSLSDPRAATRHGRLGTSQGAGTAEVSRQRIKRHEPRVRAKGGEPASHGSRPEVGIRQSSSSLAAGAPRKLRQHAGEGVEIGVGVGERTHLHLRASYSNIAVTRPSRSQTNAGTREVAPLASSCPGGYRHSSVTPPSDVRTSRTSAGRPQRSRTSPLVIPTRMGAMRDGRPPGWLTRRTRASSRPG